MTTLRNPGYQSSLGSRGLYAFIRVSLAWNERELSDLEGKMDSREIAQTGKLVSGCAVRGNDYADFEFSFKLDLIFRHSRPSPKVGHFVLSHTALRRDEVRSRTTVNQDRAEAIPRDGRPDQAVSPPHCDSRSFHSISLLLPGQQVCVTHRTSWRPSRARSKRNAS